MNMFFGVYNRSEHQDYANEFIRFMATEAELKTMATVKGMPSSTETTGDGRFTYVEALAADRKVYSMDVPCGVNALSALNTALLKITEQDANAIIAEYADRLKQ